MKHLPQISEAEYEIMKVIWKEAPINTNEVTKQLVQTTDWNPKTIQTLLKRLTQKGAVTYTKEGRVFVYSPLVQEEDYLKQENAHFLNRFYNGSFSSLLTHFIRDNQISQEDLNQLKDILSQQGEKEDSHG
ncbi:MAG TPA: BlaI/MecI/CopY family transcriptional regulator [Candidatus Hungatella pullicola]|nr:BlaI/MecI/CopY family transcriptional regulator [Candidatus Hungatella pullicola]